MNPGDWIALAALVSTTLVVVIGAAVAVGRLMASVSDMREDIQSLSLMREDIQELQAAIARRDDLESIQDRIDSLERKRQYEGRRR